VPERFDDWLAGRDPALDAALTLTDERPADDWSRELVLCFARQPARWRSFWRERAVMTAKNLTTTGGMPA
jgi:hypothetical protein